MLNPMVMVPDEVLLSRARAGDRAAVVSFANRWWPVIGRFAWSMLGNASQAAAVTREVVGTALQSPRPPETPIGRFMYRLALWLAIIRRRSNPCAAVSGSSILQALDRLHRTERAAFLLRDVEQLSLAETAAVLEASLPQVQAHVHRARLVLTDLLGGLAEAVDLDAGHPVRRTA
jgi:DNA-directed RNA polymerase specialized sigma24 family protein